MKSKQQVNNNLSMRLNEWVKAVSVNDNEKNFFFQDTESVRLFLQQ